MPRAHRNVGDAGISIGLTGHSQTGETNENNGKQAISVVMRLAEWILTSPDIATTLFQCDNLGLVTSIQPRVLPMIMIMHYLQTTTGP